MTGNFCMSSICPAKNPKPTAEDLDLANLGTNLIESIKCILHLFASLSAFTSTCPCEVRINLCLRALWWQWRRQERRFPESDTGREFCLDLHFSWVYGVVKIRHPSIPQESGLQLWTGLDVGSLAVFEVETGMVVQLFEASKFPCAARISCQSLKASKSNQGSLKFSWWFCTFLVSGKKGCRFEFLLQGCWYGVSPAVVKRWWLLWPSVPRPRPSLRSLLTGLLSYWFSDVFFFF